MKRKNMLLVIFFLTLFVFQQVQADATLPLMENPSADSAPAYAYLDHIWLHVLKLHDDGTKVSPDSLCIVGNTDPGCAELGYSFPPMNNPIYIDVENAYLSNVLPREMDVQNNDPTLPALQAQAVAARTYATWTALNKTYDDPFGYDYDNQINNSTDYQVYSPDAYDHFTNPNDPEGVKQMISTAISSTLGKHLAINEGEAIDAEFGSDIAIQSVDEPSKDYLSIIQDPISTTCGAVTNYSGWGMSQKGTLRWSKGNQCAGDGNQPWPVTWTDYRQILVHYYTGIDILNASSGKVAPDDRWNLLWHDNFNNLIGVTPILDGGQQSDIKIYLQNTSATAWNANNMEIGYHWGDNNWQIAGVDQPFPSLSAGQEFPSLQPQQSPLTISVISPSTGGTYTLHLDLRRSSGAWFSDAGWPDVRIPVQVNGPIEPPTVTPVPPTITPTPEPVCNPTQGDDPYADCVIDFQANGNSNQWKNPAMVVGVPSCSNWNFMSLGGGGGYVVVDMGLGEEILDQTGVDLKVYEVSSGCNGVNEAYTVYVSNNPDGSWVSLGTGSGITTFDLGGNLPQARYVKITDNGGSNNSSGTPGADIDAVEALKPGYTCDDSWERWFNSCAQASVQPGSQDVEISFNPNGVNSSLQETVVDAQLFYRVRDELLNLTPKGSQLTDLYYQHGPEIGNLLLLNPELDQEGLALLHYWEPKLQALVDGQGDSVSISQAEVDAVEHFLSGIEAIASNDLKTTIQSGRAEINMQGLVGQTMSQAWETINTPPDLIFSDSFESGDFSAWFRAETDGGDLSITTQAAAVGNLGVQAVVDDSAEIVLYDHTPNDEKHFSSRFYFNPNSVQISYNPTPNQQGFYLLSGSDNTSWVFCLYVEQQGEYYTLALCGNDDADSWMQSAPVLIANEWQAVEVEWKAASAPGTNDGYLKLWVNDMLVKSIENIDNDSRSISKTSLGVIDIGNGASGTIYLDAFETHQGSHIGLDPDGPAVNPPPQPGDPIFADDFEGGDLSAWSSALVDGSDLSVSALSAYQGNYGLQALIDDQNNLRVIDSSPLDETHYRARFYFNSNALVMSSGATHYIFDGINLATSDAILRVELIYENGQYKLRTRVMKDNYAYITSSKYIISNGWHGIELEWQASSAPGANDGFLALWIDGALMETIGSVDNDTHTIGEIRLGATTGIDAGTAGSMLFDNFESRRNSYIGP